VQLFISRLFINLCVFVLLELDHGSRWFMTFKKSVIETVKISEAKKLLPTPINNFFLIVPGLQMLAKPCL